MSTPGLRLPESLHRKLGEVAEQEGGAHRASVGPPSQRRVTLEGTAPRLGGPLGSGGGMAELKFLEEPIADKLFSIAKNNRAKIQLR